jgi:Ni2+-binding GTPase involved in maturation of urease and hydrogenase
MSFIDFVEVLECIAGAGKTALTMSTSKATADYRESVLTADICHREITQVTGTG